MLECVLGGEVEAGGGEDAEFAAPDPVRRPGEAAGGEVRRPDRPRSTVWAHTSLLPTDNIKPNQITFQNHCTLFAGLSHLRPESASLQEGSTIGDCSSLVGLWQVLALSWGHPHKLTACLVVPVNLRHTNVR